MNNGSQTNVFLFVFVEFHFEFDSEVRLFLKTKVINFSREANLSEVTSLMSELDLGNVPFVKIRNCPIPKDPLSSIFNAIGLNMTHIETLQYQYVPTDNTESLAGNKRL